MKIEWLEKLVEMGRTIFGPLQSLKVNEEILDRKIEELSYRESDVQEELESAKPQSKKRPNKLRGRIIVEQGS